jgi:hypothetical protein
MRTPRIELAVPEQPLGGFFISSSGGRPRVVAPPFDMRHIKAQSADSFPLPVPARSPHHRGSPIWDHHPGTGSLPIYCWTQMNIAFDARLSSIHRASENTALRRALVGLLDRYVGLVESGDAGFWDAEKEQCVINARDALALNVGGTLKPGAATLGSY